MGRCCSWSLSSVALAARLIAVGIRRSHCPSAALVLCNVQKGQNRGRRANPSRQARAPSASSPPCSLLSHVAALEPPPPRLLPAPSSPTPLPSMRRQGCHQPEPRRRPLLILLAAVDWIESAHMASPPLPPGFASRRMESPWPPGGVALAAAESQLHHYPQESSPGKILCRSIGEAEC
ncbi:uncharacterized protein [Triticum aestivum]|uniref:uncharacterized protein n=1 Tax=Triticum aestivum TaxID=4565 RepID=UPI001D00CB1E|nr:uncharacterized protein LOC123046784 [Triticum aestivum]